MNGKLSPVTEIRTDKEPSDVWKGWERLGTRSVDLYRTAERGTPAREAIGKM